MKGIVASGSSNPVVNFSDIYRNKYEGLVNENNAFTIDATNNWWGNNSGPVHTSNPSGTGTTVTGLANVIPFLGEGARNPIAGDVSLNGLVQSFDASMILRHVVNPTGPDSLNKLQRSVADVSDNGMIQAMDASYILRYVVGDTLTFPSELMKQGYDLPAVQNLKRIYALQKAASGDLLIPSAETKFGEELSIPVKVENMKNTIAVELEFDYDVSIFENVTVSLGDALPNSFITSFVDDENGKVSVAIAGNQYSSIAEGELVNIHTKVREDLKGSHSTSIKITKFIANETDNTSKSISQQISVTGLPVAYKLMQNYPNPFNPSTTIEYQIPDNMVNVKIKIYNQLGELVQTLVDKNLNAGSYSAVWKGTDERGYRVSSGFYIYQLTADDKVMSSKKLLLIK